MLNNYIPIYIIAYPKSGSTWLKRLVSDTLNSPYGNGYHSEQKLVFPDSSYNGSYKILHSHYSRMDKPNYITKDSKIFYIIRDPRDEVVSAFFHHYRIEEELVLKREFCSNKSIKRIIWRYIIFYLEINKLIRSWASISGGNDIKHFLTGIFFSTRWIRDIKGSTVGNWSDHVNYWKSFSKQVAIIRYEDLLNNTYKTLSNVYCSHLTNRLF